MSVLVDYFTDQEEAQKLKQRIKELEEVLESLKGQHCERITLLERKLELAELYGSNAAKVREWKQLYSELKRALQDVEQ